MESTQTATTTTTPETVATDNTAQIRALAVRLTQIEDILEGCKPLYEEKDTITLQLNALVGTGPDKSIFVGDKVITVIDNFADKNTVFRPAAVKRIEAKVEGVEAYGKRLKKKMKSES